MKKVNNTIQALVVPSPEIICGVREGIDTINIIVSNDAEPDADSLFESSQLIKILVLGKFVLDTEAVVIGEVTAPELLKGLHAMVSLNWGETWTAVIKLEERYVI